MTVLTDSFVPLHALLFWLRNEVVYQRFIMNNVLRYKFLLGNVGIIREVLQKLVLSPGVSISTPIWQTLCSYAEMHKIFIAQKSYCACCVLSTATIRSKYYFDFILIRTRSGRELFDRPSYLTLNMTLLAACCARLLHVTATAWQRTTLHTQVAPLGSTTSAKRMASSLHIGENALPGRRGRQKIKVLIENL